MRPDNEVKQAVESELRWRPDIDETDMAVKVNDGAVTLSGFAKSYFEKVEAENAVKHVAGVMGVANDLQVRSLMAEGLSDPEITRAAVHAIKAALPGLAEDIKVLVHQGHVTLEGNTEWHYLKMRAEHAVRWLKGVNSLTNLIVVQPHVAPKEIKRKIEDAFRRNAEIDANTISVEASGGEVTLYGKVRSWAERDEAQRTAWAAPGVTQVKNEILLGS